MCAGVFSNGVSWAAMAFIVNQAGFDHTTESVCSVLSDLYVRYLRVLANTSAHLAQLQGRTLVNIEDVINMFDLFCIDCEEGLDGFCSDWTKQTMFAPLDGSGDQKISSEDGEMVSRWIQIPEPREFPVGIDDILINHNPCNADGDQNLNGDGQNVDNSYTPNNNTNIDQATNADAPGEISSVHLKEDP